MSNSLRLKIFETQIKKERETNNKGDRQMLEKLKEMMKEQLNADMEISEETSFKDDLGADSLDLFELVMSLEETFGIEIPTEDLEGIQTVGDMMNYLKEHGAEE